MKVYKRALALDGRVVSIYPHHNRNILFIIHRTQYHIVYIHDSGKFISAPPYRDIPGITSFQGCQNHFDNGFGFFGSIDRGISLKNNS